MGIQTKMTAFFDFYALRKKPVIVDKLVVHFLQTFLVKK